MPTTSTVSILSQFRTCCHAAIGAEGARHTDHGHALVTVNRYHQRMPASADELRLPSAEDEARFWALLEAAWARCTPEADRARQALAKPGSSLAAGLAAIGPALAVFLNHLAGLSRRLPAGEVASLDRVLERKLYDIDRADIQRVTDGSDDGLFVFARFYRRNEPPRLQRRCQQPRPSRAGCRVRGDVLLLRTPLPREFRGISGHRLRDIP